MNTQLKAGDRVRVISGNYYSSTPYKEPIASNSECYVHFLENSDKSILLVFENGKQRWAHNDDTFKYVKIQPTPKWLPIDRDNLPSGKVAAMHIKERDLVFTGTLDVDNFSIITMEITKGAWVSGFTHYIPLSDLLNLPISE